MHFEYLQYHLNRRQMLGNIAKAGAAGAALAAGGAPLLGGATAAAQEDGDSSSDATAQAGGGGPYDDNFSIDGALNGDWAAATTALYGPDDQRGTINEVTPRKTAQALGLLRGARRVDTFTLGHLMTDPFPAYPSFPPRLYSQRIYVLGFQPNQGNWFTATPPNEQEDIDAWRAADLGPDGPYGYLSSPTPLAANQVSSCEERFLHGGTYQIGTQFDHFPHFGVGDILYNGWRAPDICTPKAFTELGVEQIGPFVTRGILIDVLGWKWAQGGRQDVQEVNGHRMLTDAYRITVADIRRTMRWQGTRGIEPGDAVVLRTGWYHLAEDPSTFDHYLATEPGIYLAEAKWLGDRRPALVGADCWGLEVIGSPDNNPDLAFPCHTELLVKRGIHIGEGIITDDLARRHIYQFVYSYSPQRAYGATAGNAPPMALAHSTDHIDRSIP